MFEWIPPLCCLRSRWPSTCFASHGHRQLGPLLAAILLFILGVFKCFKKPLALKRASFNSIVNNFQYSTPQMTTEHREVELEKYIQEARDFVQLNYQDPQTSDSNKITLDEKRTTSKHREELSKPDKLFVDYAYVYPEGQAWCSW